MNFRPLIAALLCIALVGCGSSEKRHVVLPPIRVSSPEKLEPARLYGDRTAPSIGLAGAMFGIVGGVVGGAIGAASVALGQKRFATVTRPHSGNVQGVIHKNIQEALVATGKFPTNTDARKEAEVRLKGISYGVSHDGGQRFAATLGVRYEIWDANGKRVGKYMKGGVSKATWTRADYEANPRLFPETLDLAARVLGTAVATEVVEELEFWLEE